MVKKDLRKVNVENWASGDNEQKEMEKCNNKIRSLRLR